MVGKTTFERNNKFMWKKVLYFGFAVIIGIVIALVGYSSNQYNHISGLVTSAVNEKRYEDVPRVFGGCFDTKSIITEDVDALDIVIYPGTSLTNTSYTVSDTKETYLVYEEAYYLYIFSPKFSFVNETGSDNKLQNKTAIRFSSGDKYYDYPFVATSSVNSSEYVEEPSSIKETIMNTSRDLTTTQSNWNFMTLTLTKTMMQFIKESNGAETSSISILDNTGKEVFSTAASLDFSQQFFTDIDDLIVNYNIYLDAYQKDKNDSEAVNVFNKFYDEWYKEFEAKTATTGYTFRYDDSELSPTSLIWQTVGMEALFLVVVILLYILLFHFAGLKRIFSRETYKDYSVNKKRPNKAQNTTIIEAKTEPESEEVKTKDTVQSEEAIESATEDTESMSEEEKDSKVNSEE